MKKYARRVLRIGLLVAGLIVLAVAFAVLTVLFNKPLVKNISEKYLAKRAGFEIKIGSLDYGFSPLRVGLSSVRASYETAAFAVDVFLDRVEAGGDLNRLFRRAKPIFRSVEARAPELRVRQKGIARAPIDLPRAIIQTADLLGYAQHIRLSVDRLIVSLPDEDYLVEGLGLGLTRPGQAETWAVTLDGERLDALIKPAGLSLNGSVQADGTVTLDRTVTARLKAQLSEIGVTAAGRVETIPALAAEVEGTWATGEKRVSVTRLTVAVPGLLNSRAELLADFGQGLNLDVKGRAEIEDLEALAARLERYRPQAFRDFRLRGPAAVEGRYLFVASAREQGGNLEAAVALDGVAFEYNRPGFPLQGRLTTRLKISGPPRGLKGEGEVRAALDAASYRDVKAGRSELRFRVEASPNSLAARRIEATVKDLIINPAAETKLFFDEVELTGGASLDLRRGSLALTGINARLTGLPPIMLSGQFRLNPLRPRRVRAQSTGLRVPDLRELLRPFIPDRLADWEFDGEFDVALEAAKEPSGKGNWRLALDLDSSGLRFSDPGFTIAGDGLNPKARLRATYGLSQRFIDWSGELELGDGESLWKDFYVSWKDQPLKVNLAGRYAPSAARLENVSAEFTAPGLGEVRAQGEVRLASPPALHFRAGTRLNLDPLYSLYSQGGESSEGRRTLKGEIKSELDVNLDEEALSVEGWLRVGEAALENPISGTSLRLGRAEIPLRLRRNRAAGSTIEDSPAGQGLVEIEAIQTPVVTLRPPVLKISAQTNGYRFEPFSFELFGGRVEFGEGSVRVDPGSFALRGSTALRLVDLDLSRLPFVSPGFPLTGRAWADFPALEISPQKITSSGQAELAVFGGRVVLRDLAIHDPFSPARAITGNVDVLDLDLKKVTDAVPFGEVTGIVRGEIRNLVVSYGQPERFDLRLESIRKKGVPQAFSLRAVDNLTVISSGETASRGTRPFWMRFIRGFRYDRIGIASTLRNDAFTLNGTIVENGIEYLVKKPALFGINVINREPEKKISFKEMIARLKRVERSDKPIIRK